MLVILGPTASGKTRLATHFAAKHKGAIISADSRQVYRGMDIGTGKDLEEYSVGNIRIPHYLIDILDAGDRYHIYQYSQDFLEAYQSVALLGRLPILCGGSGLYLETALKGHPLAAIPVNEALRHKLLSLDKTELQRELNKFPEMLRQQADYSSSKRLIRAIEIARHLQSGNPMPRVSASPFTRAPVIIGMDISREERRKRITSRLEKRLKAGLIEEVQGLLDRGIPPEDLIYYGLEYKWVTTYLQQKVSYQSMFNKLNTGIHRFAKRQMTWFRKMEKDGFKIHWIDALSPVAKQVEAVEKVWFK